MTAPPPFVLFGAAHLATMALIAGAALASALLVRRAPASAVARTFCLVLAMVAAVSLFLGMVFDAHLGRSWTEWAPLQLCDVSVGLAVAALVGRRQRAAELLWFWAMGGTVLAVVTPDLARGFPDPTYLLFFGQHGMVIVSAVTAVFGLGLRPQRGAPWRAFGWTVGWAAVTGLVDATTGANFLYLRAKPASETLYNAFGPWPFYLVVTAAFALTVFWLLYLPFLRRRGNSTP